MSYAADTSTSVEKTRAELESVIRKYGADAFGYMTEGDRAVIQFRAHSKYIRFTLPLPSPLEKRFTHSEKWAWKERTQEARMKLWEQACRSAWRALFISVKGKLVALDAKISTFEKEFMAHIVLPNGRTAAEEILPMIEEAYRSGQMPSFILALPEKSAA